MVLIIIFLLVLVNISDAFMDGLSHRTLHRPLRDFWHICKYINRASLLIIGYLFITYFSILMLIIISIITILLKIYLWDYIYYDCYELAIKLENKIKISTGIKWLDRFLGLHY